MPTENFPKEDLEVRLSSPSNASVICLWQGLLSDLNLPFIDQLLGLLRSKGSWENSLKRLLNIQQFLTLLEECEDYPISSCNLPLGRPSPHWSITLNSRKSTIKTKFRIKMLVGCDCLEVDASSFHHRQSNSTPGDLICKLSFSEPEDPAHFVLHCPTFARSF